MIRSLPLLALVIATGMAGPAAASQSPQQAAAQARAVLFFSPSCPHCHTVISEGLPPLVERFGESLVIVAINTQSLEGQRLFRNAGERYGIPPEQLGVPLLAVGDRVLVGSFDIPDQLPGIVEAGLASGGIPWPDIDGLVPALVASGVEVPEPPEEQVPPAAEPPVAGDERVAAQETPLPQGEAPEPVAQTAPEIADPETIVQQPGQVEVAAPESAPDLVTAPEIVEAETTLAAPAVDPRGAIMDLAGAESRTMRLSPWQKFGQDPAGNLIAVIVLVGMLISVVVVLRAFARRSSLPRWPGWVVAVIILAGLGVAAYLSFVEVTQSEAICGPVGDCNTVQQSPYARLFGLIPIGILGVYGYAALGLGWMLRGRGSPAASAVVAVGLWLVALVGTLFSIYLTVLEPFVIGATCMWCVTSALLMTLLLWAATPAAIEAWTDRPDRSTTT
ncbi:MAG: hypothetical protein M8861_06730 [marine benthic group bacterium]|nr:hypothetical protein [Gemmatimonadota bacterium]